MFYKQVKDPLEDDKMKELRGKKILVTGAASGIGRETALAFAREGSILLLSDIDADGLEELAGELSELSTECRTYSADVTKWDQVKEMADQVMKEFGGLDVLLNVAGVFIWADFMDTSLEDWEWMLGVNLWGPIHTMKAFLPGMMERNGGHIVNVASVGGLYAQFSVGAYCASKFALVGLGEALIQEVREHGIKVTTFCPGSTKTPIFDHIRVSGLDRDKLRKVFNIMNRMPANKTADMIIRAVKRDRSLVVTTLIGHLLYYMKKISPALIRAQVRPVRKLFNATMR
jgi:NAD(P)-dependent dehydrogenase (short-subunit alcohol dehydrogenase family)